MENNKVKLIINKEDTSVPVKVILMPYAAFADPEDLFYEIIFNNTGRRVSNLG